jgi:hypothetical protein
MRSRPIAESRTTFTALSYSWLGQGRSHIAHKSSPESFQYEGADVNSSTCDSLDAHVGAATALQEVRVNRDGADLPHYRYLHCTRH